MRGTLRTIVRAVLSAARLSLLFSKIEPDGRSLSEGMTTSVSLHKENLNDSNRDDAFWGTR